MSVAFSGQQSERELAREAAQLRIAEQDDALPDEDREAARRAREQIEARVDWTDAACALAAMTGRKIREFEPPADVEYPDPSDLELVEADGGGRR